MRIIILVLMKFMFLLKANSLLLQKNMYQTQDEAVIQSIEQRERKVSVVTCDGIHNPILLFFSFINFPDV